MIYEENRNFSEENIWINKRRENNSYFDNINKNTNIGNNCYKNITKKYKGHNRLRDIINESNDFSIKNIRKNNTNNEKENLQSNKRYV